MEQVLQQNENEEQRLAREAKEAGRAERVKKIGDTILRNFNEALGSMDEDKIEQAERPMVELVKFKEELKKGFPDYERYRLFHFLSASTPRESLDLFDVEGDLIFNFANELAEQFKLNI